MLIHRFFPSFLKMVCYSHACYVSHYETHTLLKTPS